MTGTEVLTGRVSDRNGSWLAEKLRELGVDVGATVIVGDRPDDLAAALRHQAAQGVALIITTGGLGPTADDLTAEIVAQVQARQVRPDPALHELIAGRVAAFAAARGWAADRQAATEAAVAKQALVPDGAVVLEPVGTAPGLVVTAAREGAGPPILVLPGPPHELRAMWPDALQAPPIAAVLAGRVELRQRTLRLWGTPESEIAVTLRRLEAAPAGPLAGLEVTTCLRDGGELEIVTRYAPDAEPGYQTLVAAVSEEYPRALFSTDGATVDELLAGRLRAAGLTIATAESCTAGLLAGRLTDLPGSSEYVRGGLVVYSNDAKVALAGVDPALLDRVGAVSAEVAVALADGARQRLAADLGVGITGIAGPGGGSPDKPVGLVHLCVSDRRGASPVRIQLPGGRGAVRSRTVSVAMHLIRRHLDRLLADR